MVSVADLENAGAGDTASSNTHGTSGKQRVLFSVVGYHNVNEVVAFCHQVLSLNNPLEHDIEIVVTVCGGEFDELLQTIGSSAVRVCQPHSNLGYFGGCGMGISDYIRRRGLPDWVSISNTDLTLDKQLLQLVDDVPAGVGLVSPLVVTERGYIQNPGMLKRPSAAAVKAKVLIHRFAILGALYMGFSRLKSRFMPLTTLAVEERRRITIYAAHGSIMLLGRAFFEHCKDFSNAPFLYSEELFVAEELRIAGLVAVCDTRVCVVHKAHSATRLLSLINASRMTRASNRQLNERYFKRLPND